MAALMNYGVNTNLNGVNGFGRQPANVNSNVIGVYNTELTMATDTTLTVPKAVAMGNFNNIDSKILAVLSYQYGSTVFVADQTANNGVTTAAPDASGTLTAKPGVINPTALLVTGGDILHFYAIGATAYVSVEFYSVT
jgi:hypothetical protein